MSEDTTESQRATASRPLRLGLLVDGVDQPAWVVRALRDIVASGAAEITLLVVNGADLYAAPPKRSTLGRVANLWSKRDVLPFVAFDKYDTRRYTQEGDPLRPADASALLAGVPVLRVTPRMTKFCDYFSDDDAAAIAAYDLDVAVRLGFRILKGKALEIARYGVWSFHHGDNTVNRGGPPGFWEVMREEPVTGAVLQVLSEELDAGLVLARSYSSTNPISVTANRHNYYWQAAPLLVSTLKRLRERGSALLDEARASTEWGAYSQRLYVAPTAGEMVRLAGRLGRRLVSRKLHALRRNEQWFLAYRLAPNARPHDAGGDVPDGSVHRFKELVPTKDRFWADPIPAVGDDGRRWIFFEEYLFDTPRAHISVLEVDAKGNAGTPRRVLERPYHLSYPFVFKWNGTWYMIPETLDRNAVELYRATSFPDGWELDRVLLADVPAVDATVAEIDGRWWMFVSMRIDGSSEATVLELYHAETPLGPWTPHALNPVKIDVRNARPAGPLFRYNGRWYRPAQCGAPSYGSATVVNRIDVLTPTTFREAEVSRITPTWKPGLSGTHPLAAAGGLTVIDARRPRKK